ncbi:MAG: hypothetical protein ABI587_15450 [Gemmatimonadales bacterium]
MALATLLWLTVEAVGARSAGTGVEVTAPLTQRALAGWSTAPLADTLSFRFDTAPSRLYRDWLVALRRAGTGIRWIDGGIPALVVEADRRPDPAGVVIVRVSGPAGVAVRLDDDLGALDSLVLGSSGGTLRLPSAAGLVRATLRTPARSVIATSASGPVRPPRHVVVLGAAGWEMKFVVAALTERGWVVDARFGVAPGLAVTQGRPFPLDTARHAAVIALDSTAASYARSIVTFLRDGGGALLAPDAAKITELRALAPGRIGTLVRPPLSTGGSVSREVLALHELAPLLDDAFALERRGAQVAVAVRRVGAGRIGQVGYRETWRWRMAGGPDGIAGHRAWWAALVASVAYDGGPAAVGTDEPAPRAALLSTLGAPSVGAAHSSRALFPFVLMLLIGCLFGEWSSRRLRGAR